MRKPFSKSRPIAVGFDWGPSVILTEDHVDALRYGSPLFNVQYRAKPTNPKERTQMEINLELTPIPPKEPDPCKPNATPDRPWTEAECHRAYAEVLEFISDQGVFRVESSETEV